MSVRSHVGGSGTRKIGRMVTHRATPTTPEELELLKFPATGKVAGEAGHLGVSG